MRWAFWRSTAFDGPLEADPLARTTRPAASSDEPADPELDPAPAAAFSGAHPEPLAPTQPLVPTEGLGGTRGGGQYPLDAAGVRDDLLALIRAAAAGDGAGAAAVLERLSARGPDEPGVASLIAMELLGDRLLVAAGRAPWDEPAQGDDVEAALAHGTAVAGRAAALLHAVAPHRPPDLTRLVVRAAAGEAEADARVAQQRDVSAQDVVLVAAVLLAQTVRDEGGAVEPAPGLADELAQELAELLPD